MQWYKMYWVYTVLVILFSLNIDMIGVDSASLSLGDLCPVPGIEAGCDLLKTFIRRLEAKEYTLP